MKQNHVPVAYFFDNCVEDQNDLIENIGGVLGQVLNLIRYDTGELVPQVDLVTHSMGGLIARSYLAGLQANGTFFPPPNPRIRKLVEIATPNFGSYLAADGSWFTGTQSAEMIPGSTFLWNLARWNQQGDDLRGVDALAIVGNAGTWNSGLFFSNSLSNAGDGVVSLTSASLGFGRDPSRTRILPYCHINSSGSIGGLFIFCTGKGIANVDEAPETGSIVLSFLAGTSDWASSTLSTTPTQNVPLSQDGGVYFALENAAGTQYVNDLTQVSWASVPEVSLQNGGATDAVYYYEFLAGSRTFTATSKSLGTLSCGPITVPPGYFTTFRCKYPPIVSSVGPLVGNTTARLVQSGGAITITGLGFGQQCSSCRVVASQSVNLQVLSWSDQSITVSLPATYTGIVPIAVYAANGSDAINVMAVLPAPPAALQVSSTHFGTFLQGQSTGAYSLLIQNNGMGATSGAVLVTDTLPAGLTATAINGPGWACALTTLTCSRSDALAPGGNYPPITVTVSMAPNAASPVTNQVTAWGGGSATATAIDPTTILAAFTDVSSSDAFLPAIDLLMEYAITSGCGANPPSYCETQNVTEGQMAVFVVRSVMGGDNFTYTQTPYFSDVPSSYIFFPWIQKMQDLGIALPCASNQSCPEAPVTRGIMAVLIIRGRYGVATPSNYPATPYFTDVGTNHP